MTDIGPLQLMAIGFGPNAEYKGQILAELKKLEGRGVIRVLDLLFVGADRETEELVAFDYQGDELGALVGALLEFPVSGVVGDVVAVQLPADEVPVELTRAQLEQLIRESPPDVAIGILLVEHVWARDLKRAIREAGGEPLAERFLSAHAIADIATELLELVQVKDQREREATSLAGA